VLLIATDGVYDNLFDAELAKLLGSARGCSATTLATEVAICARKSSRSRTARTPFSVAASETGHNMPGGKMDDVGIICVKVVDGSSQDGNGLEGGHDHVAPIIMPDPPPALCSKL
jgi:protein phosphatase PTC7